MTTGRELLEPICQSSCIELLFVLSERTVDTNKQAVPSGARLRRDLRHDLPFPVLTRTGVSERGGIRIFASSMRDLSVVKPSTGQQRNQRKCNPRIGDISRSARTNAQCTQHDQADCIDHESAEVKGRGRSCLARACERCNHNSRNHAARSDVQTACPLGRLRTHFLSMTTISPSAFPTPRISARYISSANVAGTTYRPGVTARTR